MILSRHEPKLFPCLLVELCRTPTSERHVWISRLLFNFKLFNPSALLKRIEKSLMHKKKTLNSICKIQIPSQTTVYLNSLYWDLVHQKVHIKASYPYVNEGAGFLKFPPRKNIPQLNTQHASLSDFWSVQKSKSERIRHVTCTVGFNYYSMT